MIIISVLLLLYVISGVSRIIRDFNQPSRNQPSYVYNLSIFTIIVAFLLSPFYWWTKVTHPLPDEMKRRLKRIKEKEKKLKKLHKDLYRR